MAGRSRPAQSAQRTRAPGEGALAALEGAALMVGHLVATPVIGRERLRWGTVGTEAGDPLPGDALVRSPNWSHTLGVAVDAPAEAVWPWIAQIGQGRGGFCTYQSLENLVGCRITNTTTILPEYQHPAVGDAVSLYPTGPALRVEVADPPHALVLFGSPADFGGGGSWGRSTWQFVINPRLGGDSRLVLRYRYEHGQDRLSRLVFGRFPLEVVSFVMSRKMLLQIKRLAELSPKPDQTGQPFG